MPCEENASGRRLDADTDAATPGWSVPFGRIAEPETIADVVPFPVPDGARDVCGAFVGIDGGRSIA